MRPPPVGHYTGMAISFPAAPDFPLVTGAASADDFEQVLLAEGGRLFAIAFAILRDPSEAEDAVQEAAAAAWRGWAGRRDPAHTRAWLTTILVRQAMRRRGPLRRDLALRLGRGERGEVDQHLEAEGAHVDLHRAYAHLSRQQRAVVALHYQQGYTLAECAEVLGCSAGAVASHLSRALGRLRKELSDG
jgi:RNA polymerase sigma factor (sigma-70 family)